MNTCIVTKDFDMLIIPKRQFRLMMEYNYKKKRYHTDPDYRRKMIDQATEWRRQNRTKNPRAPKEPKFRIQKRVDGELKTVFELS